MTDSYLKKSYSADELRILFQSIDENADMQITQKELKKINSIFNKNKTIRPIDYQKILESYFQSQENRTDENNSTKDMLIGVNEYYYSEDGTELKNSLGDNIFNQLMHSSNLSEKEIFQLFSKINTKNIELVNNYLSKTYNTSLNEILETSNLSNNSKSMLSAHIQKCSNDKPMSKIEIAENIAKAVRAKKCKVIPTTNRELLQKCIEQINKDNVKYILFVYQNTYDSSMISDIMSEYGLDIDVRISYVRHIFSSLIEDYKSAGVYVDDIVNSFENELKYQKDSWTPANSKFLDALVNRLNARYEGKFYQDTNISPNGKIDKNFKQGRTGDCWLLASIKAIANQPKGLQILNDSIKVDTNGNATVTLKGVNKTYKFTEEEIKRCTEYCTGDMDVRLLEMAIDKYFEEERGINRKPDINGNREYVAYYLLTGKGNRNFLSDSYGRIPECWFSDKQIDNFNKPNHIACVSAHGNKENINLKATDESDAVLITNHAYTVSRSDADYVYLINPWDTSTEIPVDRKTFKEFFNMIDEFDL